MILALGDRYDPNPTNTVGRQDAGLDQDAVARPLRQHLNLGDGLLVLPALLDLDDDLGRPSMPTSIAPSNVYRFRSTVVSAGNRFSSRSMWPSWSMLMAQAGAPTTAAQRQTTASRGMNDWTGTGVPGFRGSGSRPKFSGVRRPMNARSSGTPEPRNRAASKSSESSSPLNGNGAGHRAQEGPVDFAQHLGRAGLIGRPADDDARALLGRKPAIVAEVAVERDDASGRDRARGESARGRGPAAGRRARARRARPSPVRDA